MKREEMKRGDEEEGGMMVMVFGPVRDITQS